MDKEYWDKYYSVHMDPYEPSPFALSIAKYLKPNDEIVDIGCGNGRDSIYLNSIGCKVLGLDQCKDEVDYLNNEYGSSTLVFCSDSVVDSAKYRYDHAYCRFLLHSISAEEQAEMLQSLSEKMTGLLFIECRSEADELAGKVATHYRRFISFNDLLQDLISLGFDIIYAEKARGFSQYRQEYDVEENSENPELIRIVCKR